MKLSIMLCMMLLLCGCAWRNQPNNQTPSGNPNPNQNMTPNGNQNGGQSSTAKTSRMSDLMKYFDEQNLVYAEAKDLEVMDVNAHEGKTFKFDGKPVYLYRMNLNDSKNQTWMNEIKNTGKVRISQNGKEGEYDALVNGEYLLISESGMDLKHLSDLFKNYVVK